MLCLLVRPTATHDGDLILADDDLSVEYEEGCDAVGLPLVQICFDVRLDSGQASQGGEEGLVVRGVIEEELEVVGRVYCDRAVLELGDRMLPID